MDVLAQCALFAGMSEAERMHLCHCLGTTKRRCKKGEAIILRGEAVDYCAVVLQGQVQAESVSPLGEKRIVAVHGPGSIFGDVLAVSADSRSPLDILAAAPGTELLLIPAATLSGGCSRACEAHALLRRNLLRELAEKYWQQRRRCGYLEKPSLRARIAARLLYEAKRQKSDIFSLGCGREALAGELGANRSALSREISRMKEEGLIDSYRDSFRLLNRAALERAAAR